MNALITPHDVVLRFAAVRRSILVYRLLTALASGMAVFVGVSFVWAFVDFFLELPRPLHLAGLCISVVAAIGVTLTMAAGAMKRGAIRRAAAEMERHFESIGQRLRTTIDLAGRSGVDKLPLTMALASETNEECDAVNLESIVPKKQTWLRFLSVAALLLLIWIPGLFSDSWSTAVAHAVGIHRPYTEWKVTPGDLQVDEGTPVEASLVLTGRTDRDVELLARPTDSEAEWKKVKLRRKNSDQNRRAKFVASLGQVRKPYEYQFVTSVGSSPVHRIDVRYPVRIEAIELTVQRPEYTGLEDRVFEKTDVTVLEGSDVICRIRSQRPLNRVDVAFTEQGDKETPAVENLISAEPSEDRKQWSFRFTATQNATWTMRGADPLGTPMDPVDGQVRVKADRPPKLRWSSPSDSLFVHTLAEVPMSVRVEDDYGLSEAAIRFEISGNDGYTLDQFDVSLQEEGSPPTAREVLQKILPLEHFPLTEKDYIAYYAYAVDTRPGEPHRVESERRYIDIRQLKIDVLIRDNDGNNNNDGANRDAIATLDELIGRQRYLINRTRSLKVMDADELSDKLGLLDRHVDRQSELADVTRLVGERLQERGNDNLDAMFQAEASMIQASDSLTLADFESALPHQEDAQRFLVEARTELQRVTGNGNMRSASGNRRSMLQTVRQRLRRRGQSGEGQNAQRDLVARIRSAAGRQLRIARDLSGEAGGPAVDSAAKDQMNATSDGDPGGDSTPSPDPADADASELPPTINPDDPAANADDAPNEPTDGDDEPEEDVEEQSIGERQTSLLEDVSAIRDEIADMNWPSELIPNRIESIVGQMDEITQEVNQESPSIEKVQSQSEQIASELFELALNVELVDPPDPSGRLAGTRDLTASLAELEQELGDMAASGESDQDAQEIDEKAEEVARRAETLMDVAKAAADADDTPSQPYADALAQLMSKEPLMDTAGASLEKADEVNESESKIAAAEADKDEREDRIATLQKIAQSVDELLRELIEPELEMLRQLESEGTDLEEEMTNEGTAGNEDVLEFAENLAKGDFTESSAQLRQLVNGDSGAAENSRSGMRGAVRAANVEIRDRIRELILRELEADRDGPVPPEYRTAVDDYFRRVVELAPNGETTP